MCACVCVRISSGTGLRDTARVSSSGRKMATDFEDTEVAWPVRACVCVAKKMLTGNETEWDKWWQVNEKREKESE